MMSYAGTQHHASPVDAGERMDDQISHYRQSIQTMQCSGVTFDWLIESDWMTWHARQRFKALTVHWLRFRLGDDSSSPRSLRGKLFTIHGRWPQLKETGRLKPSTHQLQETHMCPIPHTNPGQQGLLEPQEMPISEQRAHSCINNASVTDEKQEYIHRPHSSKQIQNSNPHCRRQGCIEQIFHSRSLHGIVPLGPMYRIERSGLWSTLRAMKEVQCLSDLGMKGHLLYSKDLLLCRSK